MMLSEENTQKVKDLVDQDFLDRLAEIARIYGWSGDYCEVRQFVEEIFEAAEIPEPDLNPYE